MIDTPEAIRNQYRALLMQRSGVERLKMGSDMFDAARALVRASLGDPAGTNGSPDFKVRLFLRLYGRDFDPQARECIVRRLRLPARPITRWDNA